MYLLLSKFRSLGFWLLLSRVTPYLQFVTPNCLIKKENSRWLGQVLQMKDDRMSKIVLFDRLFPVEVGGCRKERFKGNGNFLGEFTEGDLKNQK